MVSKDALRKEFGKEWEKHYKLKVLEENGFSRQKCGKCKRYFWAAVEREYCGDSSCVGYEFIGNPPSKRNLGYVQTWKEIEKYFVENGHTSLKPYPTVARWRDDLYFTIASINDFQPYVVSGELEPPANPLIVPQTCIRFSDVSNVGISGRHMTNFVMFGQHAFNTKKTGPFYWKEEAVGHDLAYLQVLGIPLKEITFKEDVWIGGGNLGPSMEYFCRGVELGNTVFMQYELKGGKQKELKTKVIDMGAGLSRLAWITQGTPTVYEATYGKVLDEMKKKQGIQVDEKDYAKYARLTGGLDVDEGLTLKTEKEKIEKELGVENFIESLKPLQGIYIALDHVLTLLFTIKDGMLPSNAGGGYNLRMITRRVFGLEEDLGMEFDYDWMLEAHAKELNGLFPELQEGIEVTADVIKEEKRTYGETKEKAKRNVEVLLKKGKIKEEEFVLLYQSHGVPPEYIEEIAKKEGKRIEIPQDFYEKIRKKDEEIEEKKDKMEGICVSEYQKTTSLYYGEKKEFEAIVLGRIGDMIILDKTAFYPEGGGQTGDIGTLDGVEIVETIKKEGVVLHKVKESGGFKKGSKVKGIVDIKRRKQITIHHTAAHLLNAAARELFGNHVWQGGSGKTEEKAHLDLTHYKRFSVEDLNKLEARVNEYIRKNVEVRTHVLPRNEAEKRFGFRLYQGGAVPGKELRIVEITEIDAEACGGTHQMIKTTGEIGYFKIEKRVGVQDGLERIIFRCGSSAVKYVQKEEEILRNAADVVSVTKKELPKTVERFFDEWKTQKKRIENMLETWISAKTVEIKNEIKEGIVEQEVDAEQKTLIIIGEKITKEIPCIVVLKNKKNEFVIFSSGKKSALEVFEKLKKRGAQGGGNQKMVLGKFV